MNPCRSNCLFARFIWKSLVTRRISEEEFLLLKLLFIARASCAVLNTRPVVDIASGGIPKFIASSLYKSPSVLISSVYGEDPPVKNICGAFCSWKSLMPDRNLSGSFHSIIFDAPGVRCLPPLLSTTIASAVEASLSSIRSHGCSIHFHRISETTPVLKVQRRIITLKFDLREFCLRFNKRMQKLIPRGRTKSGNSLLSVYVCRSNNFIYSREKFFNELSLNYKYLLVALKAFSFDVSGKESQLRVLFPEK